MSTIARTGTIAHRVGKTIAMHTLELAVVVSLAPLALSSGCDVAGPEGGDDVHDWTEESQGDDDDDEAPESDEDSDEQPSSDDEDDDAPESCDELGESRSCTMGSGGSGTQFCAGDDSLTWGACLDAVECEIGETLECGYCDDPESFECEACGDWTETCERVDGEPTFVDTANGDFRLAAGSLGIDAGYRNQLVGATDLNGDPRAHDDLGTANTGGGSPSYMDLGAYEFQGFSDDDGDGVGNADDVCPGFDDNVDADIDGAPDGCDLCPGFDDSVDGDGNGVPDGCDVQPATVIAAGPRYLQVTPGESGTPVALYVTSPDAPCMAMYVDFDADTNLASQGICTLIDTPVYRLPEDWGTLLVRNMDIVPGYEYSVQPQTESAGLVASASSATTFVYGDVNNNGIANIEDAFFVVQGFQGTWAGSLGAVDMGPCYPNGIVNLGDVQQTILAFQGQAYDELCSMPCGVTAATASHAYAPTATVELEIRQGDARLGGAVEVDVWATDAIDLHTFQLAIELADASGNVRVADAMYIDADESAFAFASKEFLAADNVSRGEIGLVSLEGAIDVSSDQPAYLATFAFNGPFEPGEVLTVRFDSAGNMARDTSGRAIELLGLRTAADFEIGASSTRRAKQSGYELDRFNR